MYAKQVLADARTILLVDYPGLTVPHTLARAGFTVFAHGGPAPDDWFAFDVAGDDVAERRTGRRPDRADIVYCYRPLDELTGILETALAIGASTFWFQSDGSADDATLASSKARVTEAGLQWVCQPILDAVR